MFAGEDSRDSNPRSYSSLPCVVDRGEPSRWTIVGNMLEERHTPCTLKTSYVDSDKKKAQCSYYKRLHFSSQPSSPYCISGYQTSVTGLTHPFPHFYIVFIYVVLLNLFLS
jgi:hypothetical protein